MVNHLRLLGPTVLMEAEVEEEGILIRLLHIAVALLHTVGVPHVHLVLMQGEDVRRLPTLRRDILHPA
jgi:hypothetical protein